MWVFKNVFICVRVTVCYVRLLGFFFFFLFFITGLGQDFSCEEKEHRKESKCKSLGINHH